MTLVRDWRQPEKVTNNEGLPIFSLATPKGGDMSKKRKKLPATVHKIIKSAVPSQPDKAEIDIHDADDLYREIRVDNVVTDEKGEQAQLKQGAEVEVIIEADSDATIKKVKS